LTPLGELVLTVVFATAVVLVDAAVPELFEVVVGERGVATVVRGVVVVGGVVVAVVVGGLTEDGAALQPSIVKVEQSLANKFLMRPNSL
jgi:hypothetical protein